MTLSQKQILKERSFARFQFESLEDRCIGIISLFLTKTNDCSVMGPYYIRANQTPCLAPGLGTNKMTGANELHSSPSQGWGERQSV